MDDADAVSELLDERPELESALRSVLAVDDEHDGWTFEDVPVDSGAFGELVSRDLVEKRDGEYALADREAVGQALDMEETDGTAGSDSGGRGSAGRAMAGVSLSGLRVDRPVATLGLVGALAVVVLSRVLPWPAVFQGEAVVLSANDPYAYRYLVHQLVEQSAGPLDFSVLSSLPDGVAHGEPLMVATLWWISMLFGGASAVGGVLAWYPVVSAVVTAALVYVLAVRVTDDRRVAIAAVALLAIIPAHAFRTGLGFADHHAFDYPWLALTVLAAVSLGGRGARDWGAWVWGITLGIGVAGQTLAWDAGPLLVVPLGLFVAAVVPSWVRAGRSPAREATVFLGGLGLAALLVLAAHVQWGWHTRVVAVAPVLLFGGALVVVGLGEAARRFDVSARSLIGVEVLVGVGGFAVVWTVFPAFVDELGRGIDFLVSTGGIAETTSIVSGDLGTFIGPVFLFGFALFLAVPYLAWASWQSYRRDEPTWLVTSLYGWWFLALSVIQIRFAGQLALFAAVFGGLGFVHVAAWVDLAAYPRPFARESGESGQRGLSSSADAGNEQGDLQWPERRQALSTIGLGLGVGSLGLINTPIKHSQLMTDESMYEAARFMREYADERGWEYPDNYVFSQWGQNRMYNWFVNGESRSYGYAQNNFEEFVASTDQQEWYEQLRDQAGFVAVEDDGTFNDGRTQTVSDQLWNDGFGLDTDHYRAVWTDQNDSLRVFTLVPGARVTGPAPANSTTTIDVTAEVGNESRSIAMETQTGEHGVYQETVPLPGTYETGGSSVTVSEDDVSEGALRSAFDGDGYAHWSFNEGDGERAYDRVGGHHGRIQGAEWSEDGRTGSVLSFEGGEENYVEAPIESLQEFTIDLWAHPTALDVSEENDYRDVIRTAEGSILIFEQNGRISFRLPGVGGGRLTSDGIRTDEWNHVTVTFDGMTRAIYLGGERQARDPVSVGELSWDGSIRLGNRFSTPSRHGYSGLLGEVRVYDRVLSAEEVGTVSGRETE